MRLFSRTIVSVIVLAASCLPAVAQDFDGSMPRFEDYKVEVSSFIEAEKIDIGKYADNPIYKAVLESGYKKDVNLANKFIVIPVTCGANCQTNFIVNKETGKIIDDIGTTIGVETQVDSALIIADKYPAPIDKPYYPSPIAKDVRYYVITDNQAVLLKHVPHKDYYDYYNKNQDGLENAN